MEELLTTRGHLLYAHMEPEHGHYYKLMSMDKTISKKLLITLRIPLYPFTKGLVPY